MVQGLATAQRIFWVVVGICLLCGVAAWPASRDAELAVALRELVMLEAGFDQPALERTLAQRASQKSALALSSLAQDVETPRGGPLHIGQGARPLQGIATATLDSLSRIATAGAGPLPIEALVPEPAAVASSLRWRLAQQAHAEGFELIDLKWSPASVDAAVLQAEREIQEAWDRLHATREALAEAEHELTRTERVLEYRRRAGIKYKLVREAEEERAEARKGASKSRAEFQAAQQRYESLATQAADLPEPRPAHGEAERGIVDARVRKRSEGAELRWRFAVPLRRQTVEVDPLPQLALNATRAASFWPALESQPLADAVSQLRAEFSWHNRALSLVAFTVHGTTFLQLIPVLPLAFLVWLGLRCRESRASYNPFVASASLPRVGFGLATIDGALLCGLPLAVTILCAWSLMRMGWWPALALPLGLGSTAAAFWAQREVANLNTLRNDVKRISQPPPAS